MKKRILSSLLCLCMAISLLPATALAADAPDVLLCNTTQLVSGKYYTVNGSTATQSDEQPASGGYLYYENASLAVVGDVTYSGDYAALYIKSGTLTLTGSGNLSMTRRDSQVATGAGGLITSNYTGNLSFSAPDTVISIAGELKLETTGTLTLNGNSSEPTIYSENNVTLKGSTVSLSNTGSGQLVSADVGNVSITATGGDLSLTGSTSYPLISGSNVALSASGNLSVTNSGTGQAVFGALTASAGGDITLTSTSGSAVGGDLTVTKAANVTVSGGSNAAPAVTGTTTINASSDISINTASTIPISGTFNAGGMVILTNGAGTTVKTADGGSYAYGGNVSTSGLNLSGKAQDGTVDASYNAPAVATYYKAGSGYALFTPANGGTNAKLVLNNATINMAAGRALFLPAEPVDITVTGDNTLTANGSYNFAIDPNGQAVNITGDGNLTLTGSAGIATWGSSTPSVNIDIGGNLIISTTQNYSIFANGNVNISAASITTGIITAGNGSFTATAKTGNLTIGDGTSSSTAVNAGNITLEAPNGAISVAGQYIMLEASGMVTANAKGDIALTGTNTGSDAIHFGTGVSITSNAGSINVTTSGYSCMNKTSSGAVTLNAAKDITLNAKNAAISATGEAVNLTAGGKLSSTSAYGFQVGVLTIKANDVSVAGTVQDGIYAASVSITNPTGGNCKSVSITATSSNNSRAAISANGDATTGNITVKADDLLICGKTSAKAISATGNVTIGDAGMIVGPVSVGGTKTIDARIQQVEASGVDVSTTGLDLSTAPTEATYYKAGDGYALFTPANGGTPETLILHNASISTASTNPLCLGMDAVIKLEGTNSLTSEKSEFSAIVNNGGAQLLTIQGGNDDGLNLSARQCTQVGALTISGGHITMNGSDYGIVAEGNVILQNGAQVTAAGIDYALLLERSGAEDLFDLTISGGSTLTVDGDTELTGNLTINGSTLTVNDSADAGNNLTIGENLTIDGGSTLTVDDSADAGNNLTIGENLTIDGGSTLTVSDEVNVGNNLTVGSGSTLTIPVGSNYYVNKAFAIKNSGTIVNNGIITLFSSTDGAAIKELKLTGTGVVWDNSNYYTNDGTLLKVIGDGSGLDLTTGDHSGKTVENDGYTFSSNTLTLGNVYIEGSLTLPTAATITISTTASSTISGGIGGDGNAALKLAFTGTAPLTINGGINDGINGDTVTVQGGAQVTLSGYISMGDSGTGGTLNVTGSGTKLTVSSANGYAVMCDTVNVQNGAALIANGESMGVEALTGVNVTGGSTLTTNCDYGVYIIGGKLTVDDSSKLITNAAVAPFCIVDTTSAKAQSDVLSLPGVPTGTEIASVAGSQAKYWSLVTSGNSLTVSNESNTPVSLTGASTGTLTFVKASSGGNNNHDNGGSGVSSYTLTFETNDGTAISSVSKTSGTSVDLSAYVPTRDGYTFAGWYSDTALTQTITSVTLTKNTTVYAKWTAKNANPFTDVSDNAYYHDAVQWAVEKNVTSGTSDTTFSPDGICTRAQAVTFLWRAEGSPEPTSANCPFTDVSKDAYYYKAVLWAVEKGITKGTSATAFSPNDTVTRSQSMTFLWRVAGESTSASTNPFADVDKDAYYYNAVLWAVEKGVTQGTSSTAFSPNDGCTRAQIVTFLYRYMG